MLTEAKVPDFSDNGSTFNLSININNDTGISDLAHIMISQEGGGGDLYLVWQDNTTGNSVIYFTKMNGRPIEFRNRICH